MPSDSERDFVEPQSFSLSKKRNFACVEGQEDIIYEGTPVKAPPCPRRRMITPLPQQSSSSSMEEGSLWSAQERTALARMEQSFNNSEVLKLGIAEVDWKESRSPEVGDRRKWFAACEDVAKRMLKYYPEDSADLKVSLRELKEQVESLEEADISFRQIAKQARNERVQKLFQIFGQEEKEVHIASRARWDAHLKGLVELERRCQQLMQEVKLLGERQRSSGWPHGRQDQNTE